MAHPRLSVDSLTPPPSPLRVQDARKTFVSKTLLKFDFRTVSNSVMLTDYIWNDILRIMSIPLFDFQHCYEILESTDEIVTPVYLQEINRKANIRIFILAL